MLNTGEIIEEIFDSLSFMLDIAQPEKEDFFIRFRFADYVRQYIGDDHTCLNLVYSLGLNDHWFSEFLAHYLDT